MNKPQQGISVAVLMPDDDAGRLRSEALASRLGLPLMTESVPAPALLLVDSDAGLELRDLREPGTRPLHIDFSAWDVRRYGPNLSKRQPLARALGRRNTFVIDANAGLGQDSFLMAAMGYQVTAIERCAVLAALLQDGVARANDDPRLARALSGRLRVIAADAHTAIPLQPPADVIYLDPMFPPRRRKSALPKRELVLLRELVGDDPDAVQLFAVAKQHAGNRVVVKRPHYAPPLAPNPDLVQAGKLVRYDVYFR